MSGQIFISYRREESQWSARSLHDRLCRDFDPTQIFMHIDAIALGEDFVTAIETTVARCDVLIAVIGNNWLTTKDEHGNRRLDNEEDFVRMGIATALKREIRMIPVLLDGALMPHKDDLPEDLKLLVRRNALRITGTSFDGDCQRLAATIKLVLEKAAAEETGRLEAKQREKEGLDAEKRQGERTSHSEAVPEVSQRRQNRGPAQAETVSVVQSKSYSARQVQNGGKSLPNEEHLQIIREGVNVWNEWRQISRELIPDLSGANLTGGGLKRGCVNSDRSSRRVSGRN
jgi:TIR domain